MKKSAKICLVEANFLDYPDGDHSYMDVVTVVVASYKCPPRICANFCQKVTSSPSGHNRRLKTCSAYPRALCSHSLMDKAFDF